MKYLHGLTLSSLASRRILLGILIATLPATASAAGLSPRSVTLGTSAEGQAGSQTVSFSTATTGTIGSVRFTYCTTADGSCTTPAGLITTSATLTNQTGVSGFTLNNATAGAPYVTTGAASSVAANTALSFKLGNITNPSVTNTSYFVRIGTFTGSDGTTGPIDTGTVAVSTAEQVQLTGVTPEILIFCVGITVSSDCSTMTGSTIDFGDFSPQSTKSATSVMQASTNAAGGYNITVNGTTLSSGINTIPALASAGGSTVGTSQFGLNLKANTTPTVGTEVSGAGSGVSTGSYATSNQYKFTSGDTVAAATVPTNANTFTSSYIVNIGGAQAAGVYSATMTYICTANF